MSAKKKTKKSQTDGLSAFSSKAGKRLEWLAGKSVRLMASASEYAALEPVVVEGVFKDAVQVGVVVFIHLDVGGKARLVKAAAVIEMTEM